MHVNPSTLLSIALLFGLPHDPAGSTAVRGSPPGVVADEGSAWAVVHGGQLWVCWSVSPDCWRRVELDTEPARASPSFDEALDPEPDFIDDQRAPTLDLAPQRWRLGFWGRRSLWIEIDDQRFRVDAGRHRAQRVDEPAPTRLARPGIAACGPRGRRPALSAGRLGWQDAPRCSASAPAGGCAPSSTSLPRPRAPLPVRLRASLELTRIRSWTATGEDPETEAAMRALAPPISRTRERAGLELWFVIELGFDAGRSRSHARTRAALLRRAHERASSLPAVAPGPLADHERRALREAICGAAR